MTAPDQDERRRPSLFLERQSYRRRRLMDAARLLPLLGAAMIALPLLWPDESGGAGAVPMSAAIVYIFACWGILILISLLFGFAARRLSAREKDEPEAGKWQR
ncbi:hypothetical protein RA28_19560 [Ruegeria sp. ANG-S4]|uniref:hypothetical protein n=1 Tax=Ruegeria sp. ANG-S4 TaxID=1577904 RepID=UPI00057C9610|nr:hypothetical protein [Ruegeria sp. ANG-S4]KIC43826.1 hypothetical protein RA28_19560 [Ruegeria sp. ANG-S4]